MFTTGQRVVCVNDEFAPAQARMYAHLPKKGVEYTVRDVYLGQEKVGAKDATCGVTLVELVNPVDARKREIGFNSERFAPLQEQPDVEVHEEVGELVEA